MIDLRTLRTSGWTSALTLAVGLLVAAPNQSHAQTPAPLETIRNYTHVDEGLASAGQIAYDQIPLLAAEGYDLVVNLAIADEERNGREGFLVTQNGMTYVHIPVDWQNPTAGDLDMFLGVMEANADRKVFVHCFANMRASAFVYLYRTLVRGEDDEIALATMNEVWDPADVEQWGRFVEEAKRRAGGR